MIGIRNLSHSLSIAFVKSDIVAVVLSCISNSQLLYLSCIFQIFGFYLSVNSYRICVRKESLCYENLTDTKD